MKKLSFILVALFAVGFIMAQNTATVTEIGASNTGYVNQLGLNNQAIIDQLGSMNIADVVDNHASTLYPLLTNTKGIIQVGDENEGSIIQHNQFSAATAGPIAGMKQTGDHNTATITQMGNSVWDKEYAWAKQEGDWNKSIQNQVNTTGYSHVWQQGSKQIAQGGQGNHVQPVSVGNSAETQQIGGMNQNANIWQKGDLNYAKIYQGNPTLGYTENNLAEATQLGDKNSSRQIQLGSNNIAKTQQLTDENTANYYQNGNANVVISLQDMGEGNIANLTQSGGAMGDVLQLGVRNTLKGLDSDIMATSLDGSKLDLDQIGSFNTLSLQQAHGGVAEVTQVGACNNSVVIQN